MSELLSEINSAAFWLGLIQIIGINIVLSGDNAVVIALAARRLPEAQRNRAILVGSAGAIVLRVVLTLFAAVLLDLPFVKTVGGLLLLWIAVKLLVPEDEGDGDGDEGASDFWQAVRIVLIADFVMSLDNVIGVAAAAGGSILLLVLGLAISIPLIIFSSTLIMKWMERLPIIITAGGALLGWVAGGTIITDPLYADVLTAMPWLKIAFSIAGVALVLGLGRWLAARAQSNVLEEIHPEHTR